MPTSCEDVTAHLMELLYGELAPAERASIEGHVAGCARCRAELESFQRTRTLARQALDEAPPARVRNAILQAAAAARAQAAPSAGSATERPKRPGRWDWLRGRWTLPTLATVGAVAVFVLGSRLFLDPANTYDRGRGLSAPGLHRPQPEPRPEAPGPAPSNAREVPATASGAARNSSAGSVPAPHRHLKDGAKARAVSASAERAPENEFAPPPPPRTAEAEQPAAAQRKAAPRVSRSAGSSAEAADERLAEDGLAEPRPPAAAPPAQGAARAPLAPAPAYARSEESLRARADRLFSEGRWTEAAEAYRALLRSQPASPEADRWRQRLSAAVQAAPETTTRTPPAKSGGRPTTTDPKR